MDLINQGYFYNPSKGNMYIDEVLEELFLYVREKPDKFYDIIVGCDSSSNEEPHFPVVLVILRKGEGGRFFIKKVAYNNRKFYNYQQRILEEVCLSCKLALSIRKDVEKKLSLYNYQFRYIHADIGENGQTKSMIREVVGLIQGNGFEPKIKPESFVASKVADRFT